QGGAVGPPQPGDGLRLEGTERRAAPAAPAAALASRRDARQRDHGRPAGKTNRSGPSDLRHPYTNTATAAQGLGQPPAPLDQDFEPAVRGSGPCLANLGLRGGEQRIEGHGSSPPAGAACSSYATLVVRRPAAQPFAWSGRLCTGRFA